MNRRIPAGQPVFLADIAAYGVLELKPPFRALPIQAEAGIAIPGDWVQVLVTQAAAHGGGGGSGGDGGRRGRRWRALRRGAKRFA